MSTARAATHRELCEHHGDYGFDGSPAGLCSIGVAGITAARLACVHRRTGHRWLSAFEASIGVALFSTVVIYLHTTRRGKFVVWADLLNAAQLEGNERVLDMGCGRGAIMAMVAKLTSSGRVVGLDRWTADQSGNHPKATLRNLDAERVRAKCELVTGDMTALPFRDNSFDVVVSSVAIHNIDRHHPQSKRRLHALDEAVRVLKSGGRLYVADLAGTLSYVGRLLDLGMSDVEQRSLGWQFWYGAGLRTKLVMATKP
ncbi:MAG: class I SAM-dependent methyltransferase [Acidimicrobiales bacterium]